MNKLLFAIGIATIALCLGFMFAFMPKGEQGSTSSDALRIFKERKQKFMRVGGRDYILYVSETESQRNQGLSGVKSMNANEGMIFVFNTPDTYPFWMKDMNFSLDFIYLHDDTVVDTKQFIAPKTYPMTFKPMFPANLIIELNEGEISRNGVKVGDQIKLK